MAIFKTYIQQSTFNGTSYTKGDVVDIYATYGILCQDFPFKMFPSAKPLASRDWPDEDGADVYVPSTRAIASYDVEVTFLYVGTESDIRTNVKNFLKFLYGRNADATGPRLIIYNEYLAMGRKDVTVEEVSNEMFDLGNNDPDAIASFKVKFMVNDPTTEVTPTISSGVVTDLTF